MIKKFKNNKGITLVALVVTIVVLLILAGVSINLALGDNGIISKAQKEKNAIQKDIEEAEIRKNKLLNEMKEGNETAGEIINPNPPDIQEEAQVGEEVKGSNKPYTDSKGNTAIIPVGFIVSREPTEQNIDTGLVIKDAKNGNEFVWIPVKSEGEYARNLTYPSMYNSNLTNTPEGSTFTDVGYLPEGIKPTIDDAINNEQAEKEAVLKYHGFYVGRYEATGTQVNPTCQKGQQVLANVTQEDCKKVAQKMYNDANKASAMCSGIQWDMVMNFVDGKKDGTGNSMYYVTVSKEERHRREVGVEVSGNNLADKVQNIYDLEGNCFEYVPEKQNINMDYPFVNRGGDCNRSFPASKRDNDGGYALSGYTFRPVLYIK